MSSAMFPALEKLRHARLDESDQDGATDPETLMTAKEIARLCRVAEKTVQRWDATGLLPQKYSIGERLVRWRRADILEWIKRNAVK